MTDTAAKSKARVSSKWDVILFGAWLLVLTVLNVENGISWVEIGIALLFGGVFISLYVCFALILDSLGSAASIISLRKTMWSLFNLLITAVTLTPIIIKKLSVPDFDEITIVLVLLIYGLIALLTVQVIQCTRRVLKSDREHLPTTTQPIDPSVESSHHIVP